jgi:hypothetical protein
VRDGVAARLHQNQACEMIADREDCALLGEVLAPELPCPNKSFRVRGGIDEFIEAGSPGRGRSSRLALPGREVAA